MIDLAIVGGGPAGLAVAIAARQRLRCEVVVFDRAAAPPLDKPCGEGLMPDGRERLAELGVELPPGAPFRGIRYWDGERAATGFFPGGAGLGLRRTALHGAMVRRAERLGVELRWGQRVRGLGDGSFDTESGLVHARFLVGADGLLSRVRGWAGLEGKPDRRPLRFGVRRHFAVVPWAELVEVYWADGAEAYVTPTGPEEVGVAILWSGGKADFDSLLPRFPGLAARLAGAAATSRDQGRGPLRQRVTAVTRERLALVGDAAGYLDAITGEGLSLAFHQAVALVEAIGEVVAGRARDLSSYERAHARIGRLPNLLTSTLLAVERRPWLRRRMVRALAADPALFSRLLGAHARLLPADLGVGVPLRLAWRLATA